MDFGSSCKSQLSHNFKVSPKKLHLDDEAYKSDSTEEPLNKIPFLLWLMNDAFCPKLIMDHSAWKFSLEYVKVDKR